MCIGRHSQTRGRVGGEYLVVVSRTDDFRYVLRFRCFDITSVPSESAVPSPPLVTAQSQIFKVYSPRKYVRPVSRSKGQALADSPASRVYLDRPNSQSTLTAWGSS